MHDITRPLTPGFPVWPGDSPYTYELTWKMSEGSSVNVGRISATTHLGTHLDAPFHYHPEGATLEQIPLDLLMGPCRVLNLAGVSEVTVELLQPHLPLPPRVLLYTGQPAVWTAFPSEYANIHPLVAELLASQGVELLGTDAPSVDPLASRDLPAHRALYRAGVYILEGLNLAQVGPGDYELIALPILLVGAEAAPARVILR